MKIIVPIKQVPETNNVKMDPIKGTIVREGVESIINPLDLYAIEAAIEIREKHGGEVTVLSMGPAKAIEAVKEAIAMGCDKGILLCHKTFAGADTWSTSYVLAQAIRTHIPQFDLIFCGERAIDGDTGQVGPGIAAWLGIPFTTYISSVKMVDNSSIIVERMIENGYETLEIQKPCLITVVKELNCPRLPTLRGKLFAKQVGIDILGPEDIQAKTEYLGLKGSPTRVVKITTPTVIRYGTIITPKSEKELEMAVDDLIKYIVSKGII